MRIVSLSLLAGGSLTASLSGQTMRTYSATRPVGNEKLLTASIEYGGGNLVVGPARSGLLYSTRLRYDAERSVPLQQFDVTTASVKLGLNNTAGVNFKVTSKSQLDQTALFEFSPDVPLSLTANLGASEAFLELGGMTLRDLTVRSGASRTLVSFATPTKGSCTNATFSVGATDLDVEELASAGCRTVRVEGGVGTVLLNFGGTWRTNTDLIVEVAMGRLTLIIPRGTGVRIDGERFLSPMETAGFVLSGKTWVTPNIEKATRLLQVQLKTALAGIEVRWN